MNGLRFNLRGRVRRTLRRLLTPFALTGILAIPVFSYWMLRTGVIVPVASWLVIQIATSLIGFLAQTQFIRQRLSEAIVRRQD